MVTSSIRRTHRPWRVVAALALAAATLAAAVQPVATHAAARPAAPAPFDRQFIDMMVPHHQGATAMAQVALARAQHPQIKRLAQAIIADQNKEIAQMKTWRKAWYGSATTPDMDHMPMLPGMPMDMTHSMMDMTGQVSRLKMAKPFDRAFIDAMTPHHQMAVAAAKLELARGAHQQLKDLALAIIEGQSRELGLMQAYRDIWYGNAGMGM